MKYRHNALGYGWVRGIRRAVAQIEVVIIDFEHIGLAINFDLAKVMLVIGIVGGGETVEFGNSLKNVRLQLRGLSDKMPDSIIVPVARRPRIWSLSWRTLSVFSDTSWLDMFPSDGFDID